ncbi:MAG: protein kinase [Polyangiaceae bacterium]|nr:protein kinase [Polyangiaceae bacterium]
MKSRNEVQESSSGVPAREAQASGDVAVRGPTPEKTARTASPDLDSAPPSIPSAALSHQDVESLSSLAEASGTAHVAPAARIGELIANRYQVVGILGEGGMGIVYRCRDLGSPERQEMAVKRVMIPPGGLAAEYLIWFYKEARALAALDHPSIVHAHDYGQLADGSPFLAMELVRGASVHDLSVMKLDFGLIWSITDQILSALGHAHARGIVHGDLKPSNILVEPLDSDVPRVRILDFGLAWLKEDHHDERLDGQKAVEFKPHAGAGTPGYMAPEQIQHEKHNVCGATDLYSLGCILYRQLSGRPPFAGGSRELLRVHAFEQPEPPVLQVDAPPDVIDFVMRLLQKRPWDRFEFAAEARAEWAKWRPDPAQEDHGHWRRLLTARLAEESPLQAAASLGAPVENPTLAPVPERAPGLLSLRPSPLVGRNEIRQVLRDICDEVIDGEGTKHRLILLVGPSGVGKSRIAEWLCEVVHEEGSMLPLRARYRPMRGPLDGMAGAVLQYLNFERVDRDVMEATLLDRWKVVSNDKNGRAWVAGAVEWLRPSSGGHRPVGPTGIRFTLDTIETRRMVSRYTLERLAGGRPLLFWLDDLHHAGELTFEGLARIPKDSPNQPTVMVATVRSEDVHKGTPVADRLIRLKDAFNATVIEVPPLDAQTTCDLLRSSLPLEDDVVLEAARRSRGNPLFALQQVHAWALDGKMELSGGTYRVSPEVLALRPKTTAELWDSRVAAMPEEHRMSATAVAALGTDIRREVLDELLTSLGIEPAAAIISLQNAEVILPRGAGRFAWPHALLAEHLLARLRERTDRRLILRAAASALGQHPLSGTRRIVRLRVANLMQAGEPNAAAHLLFGFIHESWSRAREPLATLADLELLESVQGQWQALCSRWTAEALRLVGKNTEATAAGKQALEHFEKLGDEESRAHCLRLLGHLAIERGDAVGGSALVRQGYAIFQKNGNLEGLAQCEAVVGEIEYFLGNYPSARMFIQSGETHFAELSQPLGRGQCLLLLSWIELSEGLIKRSRRHALRARAEFERAGFRLGLLQADLSLARLHHRLQNFEAAFEGGSEACTGFEALRTPRDQAAAHRLLGMVAIDTDDFDRAQGHIEKAQALYESVGTPWGLLETQLLRSQVALASGDLESAAELLNASAKLVGQEAEPRQHYWLTKAWVDAQRGEIESAAYSLEAASAVYGERSRSGDHTPHLLNRLSRYVWPEPARTKLAAWRRLIHDPARRQQD